MTMKFLFFMGAVVVVQLHNIALVLAQHDTYDVSNLVLGTVDGTSDKVTYSCTFTSLWTSYRHPGSFPFNDAMWNTPLIASHNNAYQIYSLGSLSSNGFERYAETGMYNDLIIEFLNAGENSGDIKLGRDMLADEEIVAGEGGYRSQTINSLVVTPQRSYLSGISSMYPASDWFTGFNSFNAFDDTAGLWYESFTIETYPCDAGTETGSTYHMVNAAESSKQPISAFATSPGSTVILQSPDLTILPVASWHCQMDGVTVVAINDTTNDSNSDEQPVTQINDTTNDSEQSASESFVTDNDNENNVNNTRNGISAADIEQRSAETESVDAITSLSVFTAMTSRTAIVTSIVIGLLQLF